MIHREHYIGFEIDRALDLLNEDHDDWDRRGRHVDEIDMTVELLGRDHLRVTVADSDDGWTR